MSTNKGLFIVIEALDAGGSQTQTDRLAKRFQRNKRHVLQLHFPQEDRATGRLIYDKFLLDKNRRNFTKREQALLFIQDFYSRSEDIKQHISKRQGIVVSDRFYSSTMAYQATGLAGKSRQQIIDFIKELAENGNPRLPQPDLIIFLDTPVAISVQHLKQKKRDYHETRSKLTAFRNSYRRLAQEEDWIIINSANDQGEQRSIKDIHEEIWAKILTRL